jgi:hypothetical protein
MGLLLEVVDELMDVYQGRKDVSVMTQRHEQATRLRRPANEISRGHLRKDHRCVVSAACRGRTHNRPFQVSDLTRLRTEMMGERLSERVTATLGQAR